MGKEQGNGVSACVFEHLCNKSQCDEYRHLTTRKSGTPRCDAFRESKNMDYNEKVDSLKNFLKTIKVELEGVDTSGGGLIVVKNLETSEEYGFRELK